MASASYFSLWDVEQLKAAIFNAYANTGAGTQACLDLNRTLQGMTATEVYQMCETLDDMGAITNSINQLYPSAVAGNMGNIIKVESSIANTTEASAIQAAQILNSNTTAAAARTATVNVPVDYTVQQGAVSVSAGAKSAATGTAVPTALMNAAQAVIAAGIGVQLGVWIDGALYNINPDFWDSHNLSEMNPETWAESTIGEGLLKFSNYPYSPALMDDEGQMYADQEYFALIAQYLASRNAFSESYESEPTEGMVLNYPGVYAYPIHSEQNYSSFTYHGQAAWFQATPTTDPVYITYTKRPGGASEFPYQWIACSKSPFTASWHQGIDYQGDAVPITYNGRTIYMKTSIIQAPATVPFYVGYNEGTTPHFNTDLENHDIASIICYGITHGHSGVDGINVFDDTPRNITPDMTIPQILAALQQQYPDIFDKKLKLGALQPDGTVTDKYYLPIGWPDGGTEQQPESKPQNRGAVDPQNEGQSKRVGTSNKTPTTTGNDDDRGKGSTPPYVAPTGTADALYAIYNPTAAQVRDLGAWLWSSNFVDQLLKVFASPMEAIISLHKIYGTPTTGTPQNIKVGYLDSGVSSKIVTDQYIHIDCGTVNVMESFGNVFDYSPFSELSLYLPFIGIVNLDIADVMRGRVNVKYHIDVITGAVLAEVHIIRDGTSGGVIYQYTGSCAEHYPLSSGSYVGIVAGAAGIAAGVVGSVASGGALTPMLLGGAAGIGSMHTNIQRSGSFSANAGAMGIKKPYFIISRPQSAMAQQYQHFSGMGANTYCTLASCAGFVRVKFIHLTGILGATREDLQAIEDILKTGVLV